MTNSSVIKSERLLFNELSVKYTEQIYEYASDEEVTRYVAWKRHRSTSDTLEFLDWAHQEKNTRNHYNFGLIIKDTEEFIGTIGISNYLADEQCVDFGYVLNKKYWGNGYATEATKAMIAFTFQLDGIEVIKAYAFEENIASRRVLEKCGFVNCGASKCPSLGLADERIALQYELKKSDYFKKSH